MENCNVNIVDKIKVSYYKSHMIKMKLVNIKVCDDFITGQGLAKPAVKREYMCVLQITLPVGLWKSLWSSFRSSKQSLQYPILKP